MKWKHFLRYWPFFRGIHRSPVRSPHKGQWRGALMFSLICVWINGWVNNCKAGDLRRHRSHYNVIVMPYHGCGDLVVQGITVSAAIKLHQFSRNIVASASDWFIIHSRFVFIISLFTWWIHVIALVKHVGSYRILFKNVCENTFVISI